MKNKLKKLLIVFLFIIVAIMSTSKVYALDESYVINSSSMSGVIGFEQLKELWYLLCSDRGTHIPSKNSTSNAIESSYFNEYDDSKVETSESFSLSNTSLDKVNAGSYSSYESKVGQTYHIESNASYTAGDMKVCTPKAAFVLNYAKNNVGPYYSYVQQAWWRTTEGHLGGDAGENALSTTATSYQTFVKKIAQNPSDVTNTSTYETLKHVYPDGTEAVIQFPKVKDDLITANTDEVNVNFDIEAQQYVIGPLTLNYEQQADFGSITGFEIYTDASDAPVARDKWKISRTGKPEARTNKEFPDSNEKFYIRLDYIEGSTKVTNINVDYNYLIAGGSYQYLTGEYARYNWEITKREVTEGEEKKWTYQLEAKGQDLPLESQTLALVDKAARWYEHVTINVLANNEYEGYLEITKKAQDENGKELSRDEVKKMFGGDQIFKFKVTITHSNGFKEEDVKEVKAGSKVVMGPYSWGEDEEAPTYKIEEVTEDEAWKTIAIDPSEGQLQSSTKSSKTKITAINRVNKPKSGSIKIFKKMDKVSTKDQTFWFNVMIKTPGSEVSETERVSVTIPAGKLEGESSLITRQWYNDNNPTYEIREEVNEEYALISIGPKASGTFQDKEVVTNGVSNIYVNNEYIGHQKKIRLIKVIEEPTNKPQTFKFEIKVTQNGKEEIIPASITIPGDGTTISNTWESEKVWSWNEGEVPPTIEVKELNEGDATNYLTKTITPVGPTSMDDGTDLDVYQVYAINSNVKKQATIQIIKTTSEPTTKDETFKFKLDITRNAGAGEKVVENKEITLTVKAGTTTAVWPEREEDRIIVSWDGEKEKAPIAEVEELDTEDSKNYEKAPKQAKTLADAGNAAAVFNILNKANVHQGYLTIKKELEEGQLTNQTFNFKIKVSGVTDTLSGTMEQNITLKAGETEKLTYHWVGNEAPTFEVEETSVDGAEFTVDSITAKKEEDGSKIDSTKSGNKITGKLVADGKANVIVTFTNNMKEHAGKIKVIKDILTAEKISKDTLATDGTKFDIQVAIKGTFKYDGKNYEDGELIINKSLPEDGNWTFETENVFWYGSNAPTFTVTETSMTKGWRMRTITYSDIVADTSKEGYQLIDDKIIEVTITNELPTIEEIDLTFTMSGIAWIDKTVNEKNTDEYYNSPNGVYDEVGFDGKPEQLKENVQVNVYKVIYDKFGKEVSREIAIAYKDSNKNEITFPLVTKSDGKWTVQRINVPAFTESDKAKGFSVEKGYKVSYDVEFIYDGQTYEPTEFLSYQINGQTVTKNTGDNAKKADDYITAKTNVKDRYAKDSMALEVANNSRNIVNIAGKSEIDADGNTTGIVTLTDGSSVDIKYVSDDAGAGYPTHSKVITTDDNGLPLDIFKATARTSAGGLTFPFDVEDADGTSLTNSDTYVDEDGVHHKYKFIAVYNYCLNINLGLKEKAEVDVSLTKNLTTAKVVVKEKLYQYNYSTYYDLTVEKQTALGKDIKVEGTDNIQPVTLGLYRSDYYYRAEMYAGDSRVYDALTTFYSSLGKSLKDTEMDIYLTYKIKLANGSSNYKVVVNRLDDYYDSSYTLVREDESKYLKSMTETGKEEATINDVVQVAKASDYADKWDTVKTGIMGSDKDGNDKNIVYNKMTANNLGIELNPGDEYEMTLTFKVNKSVDESGIDASVILGQKCNVAEIASYSTFDQDGNAGKIDRDSAPGNVNMTQFNSKEWYEDDTFAAPTIKVQLVASDDEREVVGLAWEDNSKDENVEEPGYNQKVGDGIMNGSEKTISGLTTELVEKVMVQDPSTGDYKEYDYIWPTDTGLSALSGLTIQDVTGLESKTETQSDGTYKFKGVAAGDYVVRFIYGDKKIDAVGYDKYSTSKYYNGQDHKSSSLKADAKDASLGNNYIKSDLYLDIDKTNSNTEIKNTAIDSEVRRLQVVSNSRTITYKNGDIMYNYKDELFEDYYMFADTLKLDIDVKASSTDEDLYEYKVNNVNFGLEQRPMTAITLDKQIEQITLTTSDGKTLMDAVYDIAYDIDDKGGVKANVTLNETKSIDTSNLLPLNRDDAIDRGFRYISAENEILEGITVSIKYRLTAINSGEVDRTGKLADDSLNWDDGGFDTVCDTLANQLSTYQKDSSGAIHNDAVSGEYVGSIYYLGAAGKDAGDEIVTSTVRQMVDYVDNNVTYDGMQNATKDMSWSNLTVSELSEYIDPSIITAAGEIVNEKGVAYKNLAVSVDNDVDTDTMNNSGFIVKLQPYEYSKTVGTLDTCMSDMSILVSKYVGSDSSDLEINNIAEIIKYENTVGRRDELTIPADRNPAETVTKDLSTLVGSSVIKTSQGMNYQRDTSATETVTLTDPQGKSIILWKLQVAVAITAGLVILCSGIVLIKKKVLK